jgi:hypothetical protein
MFKKVDNDWLLQGLNVNAPELLDDPSQFRERLEVYVENSEPVLLGTQVDVVDGSTVPPRVVASKVQVMNVRWKVLNPTAKPEFPARGFVTLGLNSSEAAAVKTSKTLTIRRHEETGA